MRSAIAAALPSSLSIETYIGASRFDAAAVVVEPGYAVTANHAIEGDREIFYERTDAAGNRRAGRATVVSTAPDFDLALLKLDNADAPPARFATRRPSAGDPVVVIGSPYGYASSASFGVVSGVHRDVGLPCDCIQTDATVNLGNSGGGGYDETGAVFGIAVGLQPNAQSMGFIASIDTVRELLPRLHRGNFAITPFGAELGPVTMRNAIASGLPHRDGAEVTSVDADGPAAKAGIAIGDRIMTVNGRRVFSAGDTRAALGIIDRGEAFRVQVARGSRILTLNGRK